jgi:hypothetical protein
LLTKPKKGIINSIDRNKICAFILLWDTYLNNNYENLKKLISNQAQFKLFKDSFNKFKKTVGGYMNC